MRVGGGCGLRFSDGSSSESLRSVNDEEHLGTAPPSAAASCIETLSERPSRFLPEEADFFFSVSVCIALKLRLKLFSSHVPSVSRSFGL